MMPPAISAVQVSSLAFTASQECQPAFQFRMWVYGLVLRISRALATGEPPTFSCMKRCGLSGQRPGRVVRVSVTTLALRDVAYMGVARRFTSREK
jgi:hypothetical protein